MDDMTTWYNAEGRAVAYFDVDRSSVYLYDGTPVAWIAEGQVYGYNGRWLGWLQNGWIWDRGGGAAFFTEDSHGGPLRPVRQVRPVRGVRGVRPVRAVREVRPARPSRSLSWSSVSSERFFGQ